MKSFDAQKPLIVIHIPKAAGTSSKLYFKSWFDSNLTEHYYSERRGKLPKKRNFFLRRLCGKKTIIYGHFNSLRGFGVEDYYPTVDQFITILRDPLELVISSYFYIQANSENWQDKQRVPSGTLSDYISSTPINMLNHFPRKVTHSNYKEIIEKYFIYVGIVEQLEDSLRMIARCLNKEFNPSMLVQANATDRNQAADEEAKARFMDKHELEYLVYQHARKRHNEMLSNAMSS